MASWWPRNVVYYRLYSLVLLLLLFIIIIFFINYFYFIFIFFCLSMLLILPFLFISVDVIVRRCGGAFGGKALRSCQVACASALAAKVLDRYVIHKCSNELINSRLCVSQEQCHGNFPFEIQLDALLAWSRASKWNVTYLN